MSGAEAGFLSDAGQLLDDGKIVLLQPENWAGKRLSLLPYIDIGDELSRGQWLVVFHRQDCAEMPARRSLLTPHLAEEWSCRPGTRRVALVEIPARGEPLAAANSPFVVVGRLSDTKEWLVETPIALTLNSGNVGRLP